jgi:hypothetical protein
MNEEVKVELSLVERVFAFLKDKLTKDKAEPVNQTELAKSLGERIENVSTAIKQLQDKNVVVQDGKVGSFNAYKLGDAAPKGEEVLVWKNNQIIIATPAGTEIMAAFAMLEDRYREITGEDVEEMKRMNTIDDDEDYDDDEEWDGDEREPSSYSGRGETWEEKSEMFEDMDRYELRRFARNNGIKLPHTKSDIRVMRRLIKEQYKKIFEGRSTPPEVFFQFVKSKLKATELKDLSQRLLKLSGMVRSTELTGQRALHEHLVVELCGVVREQEIAAMGMNITLPEKVVTELVPTIPKLKYEQFEKFPRIVPKAVMDRIAAVKLANVFDEYYILYVDGKPSEKLETNEDKIKRKDPILFGKLKTFPGRLYFIIDWTDEFCDMTLAKMVNHIQANDPEFSLDKIGMVDAEYFAKTKIAAQQRMENLKNTRMGNYRKLMAEESATSIVRENKARLEYVLAKENQDEFLAKIIEQKGESWLTTVQEELNNPPKPATETETDPNR